MKKAIFSLFLIVGVVFSFSQGGISIRDSVASLADAANRTWLEKEVNFTGLTLLDEEELTRLVQLEESVLWWHFNQTVVEGALLAHPMVREARVARCSYWNCFNISVSERSPHLLALVGKDLWIVGEDGAFLSPVPSEELDKVRAAFVADGGSTPPVVTGLLFENESPDEVRARLRYVTHATETIEEKSGLTVEAIELAPGGELRVGFSGLRLTAVFERADENNSILIKEAQRLKQVLSQFPGKTQAIERVDLAFDKMAVVKLFSSEIAAS